MQIGSWPGMAAPTGGRRAWRRLRAGGNSSRPFRLSRWQRVSPLSVAVAILWSLAPPCYAQDNPAPSLGLATTTKVTALSSIELWLAYAIILFGFIVLCMQFTLLRRAANTEPEDILRLFTVTIIIIGTLALIAIGYSSQQIAPALGLFGTILGYLLGKSDERARGRKFRVQGETPESAAESEQP
jgi:hypothetical protein